jgi:maleate isomerase
MTDPLSRVRGPHIPLATITPSGNVVVERVTSAILADFSEVSGHFSRTTVVGSTDRYSEDYDWPGMLSAAELLSHVRPASIVWNGSKGGSIGFGRDRLLCRRITESTGVPATTSSLAIAAALRHTGARRLGLITPYTAAYADKIPPHFADEGFEIVARADAGVSDNLSYAAIPDDKILAMARATSTARPDALITYCTNFPAAHLVAKLEAELGLPVYDSVSAGVWGALRAADIMPEFGLRWGSLFGLAIRVAAI